MKFVPHYSDSRRDNGVIEAIETEDDGEILINIRCDDGSVSIFSKESCHNFEPKVGQRVKTGYDEDDKIPGWMIVLD